MAMLTSSNSESIRVRKAHSGADREVVIGAAPVAGDLGPFVPPEVRKFVVEGDQKVIPALAKDPRLMDLVEDALRSLPTTHRLMNGDCRSMDQIANESVHLVVTSPPYWNLKEYTAHDAQLGSIEDYEAFLDELDKVWRNVLRVLVPGGRMVIVVGDVCLPRRKFGRHVVFPLHSSIQERCRKIGFDNLAPIIWHKIANAKFEVENGSSFLGKPYEPNGIIKNDIEYIIFQRKAGGYRQPSLSARTLSTIPEQCHKEWFQQIWTLHGASTRNHPAPFPIELSEQLIRMYSFAGDTVLDPFMGTGTTNAAAYNWGRHSIGIEVIPEYFSMAAERIRQLAEPLLSGFPKPQRRRPSKR